MKTLGVLSFVAVVAFAAAGHLSRGGHGGGHHFSGGHHGGHHGGFGGGGGHENYGPPQPYQFDYSSQDAEGTHGHSQSSDGRRVQGHYVIQLADGRNRKVEYHADETGFHAKVVTNELGTESKDAADATYQSSAVTGEQAALQYGGGSGSYGRGHHGGGFSGHHGGSRGFGGHHGGSGKFGGHHGGSGGFGGGHFRGGQRNSFSKW